MYKKLKEVNNETKTLKVNTKLTKALIKTINKNQ